MIPLELELEQEQRAAVVKEALSWTGTIYHHMGRLKAEKDFEGRICKQGAVDCAMLVALVYENAGIVGHIEVDQYPADWYFHRSTERYMEYVTEYAREISADEVLAGDLVLYKFGHCYAHGAIIVDPGWPNILHAHRLIGKVVQDTGHNNLWGSKPRKFFSFWGGSRT